MEKQQIRARFALYIMATLTGANILAVLALVRSPYQQFPYLWTMIGPGMVAAEAWGDFWGSGFHWEFLAISFVMLSCYVLFALLSKRRPGWLKTALVCFSIDSAVALTFQIICIAQGRHYSPVDIVQACVVVIFHAVVLLFLAKGVRTLK